MQVTRFVSDSIQSRYSKNTALNLQPCHTAILLYVVEGDKRWGSGKRSPLDATQSFCRLKVLDTTSISTRKTLKRYVVSLIVIGLAY